MPIFHFQFNYVFVIILAMIKEKIKEKLKLFLKTINIGEIDFALDHPHNAKFGDYSTNLALKLTQNIKKSPKEIGETIVKRLGKMEKIEKIEVAPSGFINFFLSKQFLISEARKIALREKIDSLDKQRKTILLEYGQPNTHKLPHLGHLYSYIYGESLARILEFNGNKVYRVNYQGDIGLHVAKCLYQVKNQISAAKKLKTLEEKVKFLQRCYQEGASIYKEDKKAQQLIDELNIKIYKNDPTVMSLWQKTRRWSLDFYKEFEDRLGIKFDRYYFESETASIGKEIVLKNLGKFFEESQGAIIFKGEKYNLHTRVFINRYGNPTYEAKDLGLIYLKQRDFNFDLSIVTTANEQNEYWQVVIKVSELLFPTLLGKLKHIGFGMVNLTSGRMSSRTGRIIDPFTLFALTKKAIQEKFFVDESLSEKIALSAIKYSLLSSEYQKNIVFDLEKSIAKEGNCGPYLLYTYVRTQSVLKKSKLNFSLDNFSLKNINLTSEEEQLLRFIYQFEEIVDKTAKYFNPSLIANFLYQLASAYNLFYQKQPILKASSPVRNLRLLLTKATGIIIKKALFLLGIETVEKM